MTVLIGEKILAGKVGPADSFFKRLIGLMGKNQLNENEGLLLFHCSAIHCFFMKFAIDAVYLSSGMKVLGIETLKPWKIGRVFRGAKHVLELPAGFTAGRVTVGDILSIKGL